MRDSALQMNSVVGTADLGEDSWRGRRVGEMRVMGTMTGLKLCCKSQACWSSVSFVIFIDLYQLCGKEEF